MGGRCRVAELVAGTPTYFWTTMAVPREALRACPEPIPTFVVPVLPVPGTHYAWVDRKDGLPPTGEPHPPDMGDETVVAVIGRPSWLTTRVRRANDPPGSRGFLVYTHHLRRDPVPMGGGLAAG